eukprot:m51a1_g11244 hypothetical protein (182) ;mRNA; f:16749-25909
MATIEVKMEAATDAAQMPISECLKQLRVLLAPEAAYWFERAAKTADRIGEFIITLDLLETFVNQGNVAAFLLVLRDRNVSIKGIKACFLSQGQHNVCRQRLKAHQLFRRVCYKMVCVLQTYLRVKDTNKVAFDSAEPVEFAVELSPAKRLCGHHAFRSRSTAKGTSDAENRLIVVVARDEG